MAPSTTALASLVMALLCGITSPTAVPEAPVRRPATYTIDWTAPAECPDAETIHERVAEWMGERTGGEGVLDVRGTVAPRDDAFVLTLETTYFDHHDVRVAEATTCMDLGETVALVIAIALEPDLTDEDRTTVVRPPSEPPPKRVPAATIAEPPTPEPVPATPLPEPKPARVGAPPPSEPHPGTAPRIRRAPDLVIVRLAPQVEYGRLPPPGGGIELAIATAWPRARLELHGSYLWPRRGEASGTGNGLYQFGGAGLRGCGRLWAGRVATRPERAVMEFPICLGLEAGGLRVDSRGLDPSVRLRGRWLAPTAGAGIAIGSASIGFWSLAEAAVVILGSRYHIGETIVFRPAPVTVRLLVGLELRFAVRP